AHLLLQVARLPRLVEGLVDLPLALVQRAQECPLLRRQPQLFHLQLQRGGLVGHGPALARRGRGGHGGSGSAAGHAGNRSKTLASGAARTARAGANRTSTGLARPTAAPGRPPATAPGRQSVGHAVPPTVITKLNAVAHSYTCSRSNTHA